MRQVFETKGESLAVGKFNQGCNQCILGQKMVLFVTGNCPLDCWYCTISHNRWQVDKQFANEHEIKSDEDIITEAKAQGALGAGITGGEPALFLDRIIHYIKLLKKNFGPKFHIHMYTSGFQLTDEKLKTLHDAGLDEIRFHVYRDTVKRALKFPNWRVGMEVPCIPGKEKEMSELVDYLDDVGAHFLNLNELEFSERNNDRMEKMGYVLKDESLTAIEGSWKTALRVLSHSRSKELNVHFCTAALKMNYQLRNRLVNRANNIKKPFEEVLDNGLIRKGIVFGAPLKEIEKALQDRNIDLFANEGKQRIEISYTNAKKLAKEIPFKFAIVMEYPSAEAWDFEVTPINYKPSVAVRV